MPITPDIITKYLDIDPEKFETEEAFKEHFDGSFLRRDVAHHDKDVQGKVFGKVNDVLRTKLKKAAKTLSIDGVDFDKIDPTEGIETLSSTLSESITSLRTELDAAKKGGKTPAELEDLRKQLQAVTSERDAFGTQAKEFQAKFTELEGSVMQEKVKARTDGAYQRALDGITFRDDVSPFAKKGFESEFRSKYRPEFSEDGGYKVLDADGAIVMRKGVAQQFATLDELAKSYAEEAKLTGGNAQAGTAVKKTVSTMSTTVPDRSETAAEQGGRRKSMPSRAW